MSEQTTETETNLSSRNLQGELSESGKSSESNESVTSEDITDVGNSEGDSGKSTDTEPETFPRDYVQKLRDENAKYRQRAQKSDELAHRLHEALVAADGRLADPTDLQFSDAHLEDSENLTEAIGQLIQSKPHLAARRPRGDVGQGASGGSNSTVDLAGLLRAGAN